MGYIHLISFLAFFLVFCYSFLFVHQNEKFVLIEFTNLSCLKIPCIHLFLFWRALSLTVMWPIHLPFSIFWKTFSWKKFWPEHSLWIPKNPTVVSWLNATTLSRYFTGCSWYWLFYCLFTLLGLLLRSFYGPRSFSSTN